jgi:predicted nucleic acid-binding protein
MSGNNVLLDSNVVIYASRGLIDVEKLLSPGRVYYASIVTYIEVHGYGAITQHEQSIVNEILNSVKILNLDREIAGQAIVYRKIKKIRLPDAVVLASAKWVAAELITNDVRDFTGIDPAVRIGSLDGLWLPPER